MGHWALILTIALSIVGLDAAPRNFFKNAIPQATSVREAPKGRKMQTQAFNPIFTLPSSQTLPETQPYILSDPIKIEDPDAPEGCIEQVNVTLNPQQGALYFWPGFNDPRNGFDTPAEYMDGLHAIYIKGSLRQINWALSNLKYIPPTAWHGSVNAQLVANDLGCGGGSGTDVLAGLSLLVQQTNTAPELNLQGYAPNKSPVLYTSEDQPVLLNFVLSDVDAGTGAMEMNLTASNGHITLKQVRTDLMTFKTNTPTFMEISSNQVDLQNWVLQEITFTPSLHYNGLAVLTISVNDLGNQGLVQNPLSDTVSVVFNISAAADNFHLGFIFEGCMEDSANNPIYVDFYNRDIQQGDKVGQFLTVTASVTNGTLAFASSTATYSYDPASKVYTLFGNQLAIERATNGTTFTPDPDFFGMATFSMTFAEWPASALMQGRSPRNVTKTMMLTVTGINDAPRLIGADRTWHAKYGQYIIIDQLTAYDPDINPLVDLVDVTINSTYGELTLGWRPYWLSPPAFMDRSLLPGGSHKNSRVGFKLTTTIDGLNKILGSIHDDHPGLGYLNTKPLPPAIHYIDTAVHDVDYLTITINDRGQSGTGGALESTFKIKITSYVDQYPTCQSFLNTHAQYCGCYFVTGHQNSSFTEWSILPLTFPSKLYAKESAPARFSQGCCSQYLYSERASTLTRVAEMGLCQAF
jgi:hypothetical protein|uniref:Cadherin domain-containing protein n=1 Tax=Eutreptiella gymnastica TaxID=73025 RepID=A0A7S4GJ49_9EUGL|mmetsp:Transcript_34829/g.58149  ORF Transcript_34829/g.58149 Transcript_34829/m.58149 type:complete len:693 (+) Transcript_34829:81-2159(+)|eukprot:CAMPEP_0174286210 /NCGR_PEP_ID=MMETSP0809-20121228/10916_1 /TAXON_ID=73025 ORGANISM="Eutreptiella gymnastica-like, Strain CCMP1594" /NCGR_SAMPLE_ID=MMETSP0809 /ASSEMBLY_ACC=CAM_ASM_000658 /LENGTH=692 /DNA_ID=CAMNT_0015382189 /DNA_START=80 /DNA_END=2158 /DNA_ORIENTATION=+